MRSRANKFRASKGDFSGKGKRIGIVVAEFNEFLTDRLLAGAVDTLLRHGVKSSGIHVVYVPGAFEIPIALQKALKEGRWDAAITLAVVIRGQTKHFDQVATESARGVRELSMKSSIPVILGLILAESVDQAIERVGIKHANKGREWALAALEMADLMKKELGS